MIKILLLNVVILTLGLNSSNASLLDRMKKHERAFFEDSDFNLRATIKSKLLSQQHSSGLGLLNELNLDSIKNLSSEVLRGFSQLDLVLDLDPERAAAFTLHQLRALGLGQPVNTPLRFSPSFIASISPCILRELNLKSVLLHMDFKNLGPLMRRMNQAPEYQWLAYRKLRNGYFGGTLPAFALPIQEGMREGIDFDLRETPIMNHLDSDPAFWELPWNFLNATRLESLLKASKMPLPKESSEQMRARSGLIQVLNEGSIQIKPSPIYFLIRGVRKLERMKFKSTWVGNARYYFHPAALIFDPWVAELSQPSSLSSSDEWLSQWEASGLPPEDAQAFLDHLNELTCDGRLQNHQIASNQLLFRAHRLLSAIRSYPQGRVKFHQLILDLSSNASLTLIHMKLSLAEAKLSLQLIGSHPENLSLRELTQVILLIKRADALEQWIQRVTLNVPQEEVEDLVSKAYTLYSPILGLPYAAVPLELGRWTLEDIQKLGEEKMLQEFYGPRDPLTLEKRGFFDLERVAKDLSHLSQLQSSTQTFHGFHELAWCLIAQSLDETPEDTQQILPKIMKDVLGIDEISDNPAHNWIKILEFLGFVYAN